MEGEGRERGKEGGEMAWRKKPEGVRERTSTRNPSWLENLSIRSLAEAQVTQDKTPKSCITIIIIIIIIILQDKHAEKLAIVGCLSSVECHSKPDL